MTAVVPTQDSASRYRIEPTVLQALRNESNIFVGGQVSTALPYSSRLLSFSPLLTCCYISLSLFLSLISDRFSSICFDIYRFCFVICSQPLCLRFCFCLSLLPSSCLVQVLYTPGPSIDAEDLEGADGLDMQLVAQLAAGVNAIVVCIGEDAYTEKPGR